jgi:uncharacterized protein YecA (UPF0149 family)
MGAIADGIVAFAQPLLDQTDGSIEQVNKAFAVAQLRFNLALSPEEDRAKSLSEMQPGLGLNDEELEDFRQSIIVPMIRRHEKMFPHMHKRVSNAVMKSASSPPVVSERTALPQRLRNAAEPYSPCPCNSGKKYRFCCGRPR